MRWGRSSVWLERSACHAEGREFESRRSRHFKFGWQILICYNI